MSVRIYPVTKTETCCCDFEVKINGIPADLNTARVSAIPFNRRWPGHQRAVDQSELINFLSLSTDETVTFEITPKMPFDPSKVVVRPRALEIKPECADGRIVFTLPKAAYCTVEPWGRSKALHIFADPVARYEIDRRDANVLYFGAGEHDVGHIELTSNQTLFLDEGAVVYACIHAIDAENIKILGRGILDNSRNHAQILFEHHAENNKSAIRNAVRRRPIQLEYCENIEIEGITLRDSLVYNIHPRGCRNLHISNVKIIGNWRYNSDGIDMHNCEDVLIENCFVRTFDDCICVKGFDCFYEGDVDKAVREAMYRNGECYDVFKNAVVRNCTLWNDWGKCLEIGAETRAEEIHNIVFENCHIIHAMHQVLDCCNMDYANIYDVVYRNIDVEFDEVVPKPAIQGTEAQRYENTDPDYTPELIKINIECHHEYSVGGKGRGKCHHIKFENIHLYGRQQPKLTFIGYDEGHKVSDITVEDLYWNDARISSWDEVLYSANEFTESISLTSNAYAQMDKNNVQAQNQLQGRGSVRFFNPKGKGKRVVFVGNSMTLHGIKEDLGWTQECGMAASAPEKDYVHRIMAQIQALDADPAFCICQVSSWEAQYKNGEEILPRFEEARAFGGDIIVMRFIENCPKKDFEPDVFKAELQALLKYLNGAGKATVVLTTGFWHHPGDAVIEEMAKEQALPLVKLGDLGERDEMKAIGLFDHTGVANHPGDLGMEHMAERIFAAVKQYL